MADIKNIPELRLSERIGGLLRELLEHLRREPLPERWADLLARLNAEEDARNARDQLTR